MDSGVLLIRHTETYGNISEMIGYTQELDRLTLNGHKQAIRLGKELLKVIENSKGRIIIYVSGAYRTRETAIIAGILTPGVEFIVDHNLNEIHMGNLLDEQIGERNGGIFHAVLSSEETPFPDGESVGDVQRRILPFLQTRDPKSLHICFTSGVVIKSILLKHAPHIRHYPKNGSITRLKVDDAGNIGFISYEDLELYASEEVGDNPTC